MAGFTKLFSDIVHSTVWREDMHVKIVWITMLAMADRHGCVLASIPGLADMAKVSLDQCLDALAKLSGPDPYSRTKDYEGRRITDMDGGWLLLNYDKYRARKDSEEQRLGAKERKRRQREREAAGQQMSANISTCQQSVTDVTESVTVTQCHAIAEAEAEAEADTEVTTTKNVVVTSVCMEPSKTDDSMPAILLPTNNGKPFAVSQALADEMATLYPAVDVVAALRAMRGWLLTNSERRKTARGMPRFINNWLAKEQDRGRPPSRGDPPPARMTKLQRASRAMNEAFSDERVGSHDSAGDGQDAGAGRGLRPRR